MKKAILILMLALPFFTRAQVAVIDVSPDKKGFQIKNIANQVKQISEQVKQNETLVKTYQTAMNMKRDMSDILRLQAEAQKALLTVKNIRDLTWSDMKNNLQRVSGISFDYASLVPNQYDGDALRMFTKDSGFGSNAKTLYLKGSGRSGKKELSPITNSVSIQTAYRSQLALADAASVRKLQSAAYYEDMAEELAKKAIQLSAAINAEGKLSMSSAERLNLLKSCSDAMMESVSLRLKADELRKDALQKTDVQKEQSRREQLEMMRAEIASYEKRSNGSGLFSK